MKRVELHTLGCKLNLAETATIGRQFSDRGFRKVDQSEQCDVFVLNTCTVTEKADRECRQLIRRVVRKSPEAFVIVVGCYAQLRSDEISSIPGVDLILGSKEKLRIFDYAHDFKKIGIAHTKVSSLSEYEGIDGASSIGYDERTRAFLKIQDGCDYSCSFCTIPLARGESRSVPISSIVLQAENIVEQGYKEIVLTGVNVGDYGRKDSADLLTLLQSLVNVSGLERIRISSIEPNLLDNQLLDFWLNEEKVCKHFHIPLQSGSDDVLKMMRRRYQRNLFEDRILAIRKYLPQAGIGVDVIVGFPGETDDMFEETYCFLRDLPVSYLHVFTYSERPSTDASKMNDQVRTDVRSKRNERLRALSVRKRRLFYEGFRYREVEVLFEQEQKDGVLSGLTGEYVRVLVPGNSDLINSILKVQIQEVEDDVCRGLITNVELVSPRREVIGI